MKANYGYIPKSKESRQALPNYVPKSVIKEPLQLITSYSPQSVFFFQSNSCQFGVKYSSIFI